MSKKEMKKRVKSVNKMMRNANQQNRIQNRRLRGLPTANERRKELRGLVDFDSFRRAKQDGKLGVDGHLVTWKNAGFMRKAVQGA